MSPIKDPSALRAKRQVLCLAGCASGLSVSIAPAYLASFSIFLKPMADDLGWQRSHLALAITLFGFGTMLTSPLVGNWIDRWGSRRMIFAGALALPALLILMGMMPPRHAAFLAIAVGFAAIAGICSPVPYLRELSLFFDSRLGMAIAVALAMLGAGQMAFGFVSQHFIASLGWRHAWVAIGILVFLVGMIAYFLVPWQAQLALKPANAAAPDDAIPWSYERMLRYPRFWLFLLPFLLITMVTAGTLINLGARLADSHISGLHAASVLATATGSAIVGRLVTGLLVDRMSFGIIGGILFFGQAVGCLILGFTHALAPAFASAALIGLAYGAESDLLPYAIRREFGRRSFGRVFGLLFGLMQIGLMIGPILAARIFDSQGSYQGAFMLFAGCSTMAGLLILAVARPVAVYS